MFNVAVAIRKVPVELFSQVYGMKQDMICIAIDCFSTAGPDIFLAERGKQTYIHFIVAAFVLTPVMYMTLFENNCCVLFKICVMSLILNANTSVECQCAL